MPTYKRNQPPVEKQIGPTCWVYALASYRRARGDNYAFPEMLLEKYRSYTTWGGALKQEYWRLVADAEGMDYEDKTGTEFNWNYVAPFFRSPEGNAYLYVAEYEAGLFAHAYVVYGVSGSPDSGGGEFHYMDPMVGAYIMKPFGDVPDNAKFRVGFPK
jgi:hypothetical protein